MVLRWLIASGLSAIGIKSTSPRSGRVDGALFGLVLSVARLGKGDRRDTPRWSARQRDLSMMQVDDAIGSA